MKKVFIFITLTLGMLIIIALEGRSLREQQLKDHCYDVQDLSVVLIKIGYEWALPLRHDNSHHAEI
jgi:hypothetical protein